MEIGCEQSQPIFAVYLSKGPGGTEITLSAGLRTPAQPRFGAGDADSAVLNPLQITIVGQARGRLWDDLRPFSPSPGEVILVP